MFILSKKTWGQTTRLGAVSLAAAPMFGISSAYDVSSNIKCGADGRYVETFLWKLLAIFGIHMEWGGEVFLKFRRFYGKHDITRSNRYGYNNSNT